MIKFSASVLVASLVVVTAAQSAPAPAGPRDRNIGLDSDQPIAVNADSFLADLNGETGTYTGNVIVTQGRVRLHADEVKVTEQPFPSFGTASSVSSMAACTFTSKCRRHSSIVMSSSIGNQA